jgi:tetratricopeptide (TPR) repeat protein
MNLKPVIGLVIVLSLLLQLKNCNYGAEHQDVEPKYKGAHLAAVNGQNLLKEKRTAEALVYYEMAREELEHPDVRGDRGADSYINYGFVLNDIGVIHLAWALYGREPDPGQTRVDPAAVDPQELEQARSALQEAVAFYLRWYPNNPRSYERFAKAISESYANLGTALKYGGQPDEAGAAFRSALRHNPRNGNAEHGLELLGIDPAPAIEEGKAQWEANKRSGLL